MEAAQTPNTLKLFFGSNFAWCPGSILTPATAAVCKQECSTAQTPNALNLSCLAQVLFGAQVWCSGSILTPAIAAVCKQEVQYSTDTQRFEFKFVGPNLLGAQLAS